MKTGIEMIAEERQRQIEAEGYNAQHDSQHTPIEFIYAALAYAESAKVGVKFKNNGMDDESIMYCKGSQRELFPWDGFKPSTDIRDLVKAGALIAAAIDRLQNNK